MTIESSTVTINRPNGSELKRRIKDVHAPHIGKPKSYNRDVIFNTSGNVVNGDGDILFADLDAYVANHAVQAESSFAEQEIQQWITEIEAGRDPSHIDMGGYFVHSVPEFNTWEDATDGAVTPYLQVKQPEHTQALVKISDLWGRLTNKEGEAIAGKPNDVAAEIQGAINRKADDEAYIALIDEEGEPRG